MAQTSTPAADDVDELHKVDSQRYTFAHFIFINTRLLNVRGVPVYGLKVRCSGTSPLTFSIRIWVSTDLLICIHIYCVLIYRIG